MATNNDRNHNMGFGHVNDHDHDNENDHDGHYLSRSYDRAASFEKRVGFFDRHYKVDKKWECVSPMTHHVIREPISPARLRRRRSRSFNDFVDAKRKNEKVALSLPTLEEVKPPPTTTTVGLPLSPKLSSSSSSSQKNNEHSPLLLPPLQPMESRSLSAGDDQASTQETIMPDKEEKGHSPFIAILYGVINATIVLPVVMSFGNIIYQDDSFAPYAPVLIKLTLVSGLVHQLCFSALSSLPFAVGSVQDAGLIFLSSMASDMAAYCRSKGHDDDVMLATVTVGLGLAAALLGCGLITVGKLQLAGYVQMLPTCVVAGYLAFIGWFCGKSGIGIMAGSSDVTLSVVWDNIIFVLPGILGGAFIYCGVRTFKHVAVLPTCIVMLLLGFYIGLAIKDSSIEQATENGWIRKSEQAPVWYQTWDYLKLSKVDWEALPQLLLTELSMIFVVALSSCLDVAAIELELKQPLNYNQELTMVGMSNVLSGLTGGYTGSYIFSQTIFSLRSGIRSRLAGFVIAFCEFVVIVAPVPILSYVPNFFYGSLLGMICIDLVYEWLWEFKNQVTVAEYLIGLTTFGLIQFFGVEYGILLGVAAYVVCRQLGINVGELKYVTDDIMSSKEEEQETHQQQNGKETTGFLIPPESQRNGTMSYNAI